MKIQQIFKLIKSDLTAVNAKNDLKHILLYFFFSYNKRPLIMIRLLKTQNKSIVSFCRWYLRHKYMIEVSCPEIGEHLRLPHPRGIILCAKSIGSNCLIGQYSTLGGNNCKTRIDLNGQVIDCPEIGNNVQILSGSVVAGPIILGNEIVIGANSTVTFDVPSNTLIYNRPTISTNKIKVPGYLGPFYRL